MADPNKIQLAPKSIGVENEEYLVYFIRQRRNLMIASVLLFFAKYSEVVFEGPLFGFKGKIDAGPALALFVAYFLLRYLQYFFALGDKGIESARSSIRGEMVFALGDLKGLMEGEPTEIPPIDQIEFKSKIHTLKFWVIPWFKVIFLTNKFTEYFLPFFVSVGALIYYFWSPITL